MARLNILMITYNNEKYIAEQINSIILQTYKDWELIISDDCSSDSTVKIVSDYAKTDTRIKIIRSEANVGIVGNFKKALAGCDAELVALCDGDDYWEPEKLSEQVRYLDSHPRKNLVYHDSSVVDEKLVVKEVSMQRQHAAKPLGLNTTARNDVYTLLKKNTIPAHSMLFRSDLIAIAMLVDTNFNMIHDHWIALNSAMTNGIGYLESSLVRYRQHPQNVVGTKTKGLKFYINKFGNAKFANGYTAGTLAYNQGLTKLTSIWSENPNKYLIDNKIECGRAVVNFIQSETLYASLMGLIEASRISIQTSTNYYFSILGYWTVYKIIRKFV